jgi:hypothetical protein
MATYHDITQATCINCGRVTLETDRLEIMNDLGAQCDACGINCVAWTTGTGLVITFEDNDGERHRHEIERKEEKKMSFAQYLESIKPLTVGDLRKVIANLPDNVQILMAPTPKESNSDWLNVSHEIGLPDEEMSNYSALTFFPVDNYDSRQF